MSSLHQKIAELSPEKRELLLQRLKQKQGNITPTKIARQSRESNSFPLSFSQQRLWFFNQLEPDSCAYNIPAAVRLTGLLNISALSHSISEILRRHEALRTTFTTVDGQPVQTINPAFSCTLPLIDLQALSQAEREQETLRLARAEAQRPFDLEKGPLLRVTLLRLEEQAHVILFTMHHIVSDGWSTGILIRELTTLYTAYDSGQSCNLPELPIQYVDFAVWQRQWLQGEVLNKQLNYWKQQLGGDLPVLELPTDRPRPAIQTDQGATQSFTLSPSLTAALKNLSHQEGVTLFMTLLAAFKVLLHRYTQQDDILVGTPIANRNRSEIEGLIGFFINTLVLRSNLAGNPTFKQLLAQVREVTLGAYAHQDLPFEQLVEELQPERDLSHSSLFQVMFILQNAPTETLHLPNLTLNPLTVESKTANFDLTLSMVETEAGLKGGIEYNTDLFNADRITRMLGHLQTLLAGIIAYPQQTISDLPLLTATEYQQIITTWNSNKIDVPQQCIHQLFEAQVNKTPDAVAVVFKNEQLTYRKLNQRANQLAHYLQKLGVGPEALVGICVERSLLMVVGLLAVLKAGTAYVPLDPTYPQERIAFMLSNAQVSVVLTQEHLLANLQNYPAQIVCIDHAELIEPQPQHNPVSQTKPDNLAYVIYTSGSTGKPKGVMIAHRSLVNFTQAAIKEYKITASDRILQFASISFDAAAEEIFPSLAQGATLVLRTDEMLDSIPIFLEHCSQQSLTVLDLPTAFWQQLTTEFSSSKLTLPPSLRLVIIGGEKALLDKLSTWQQNIGLQVRLVNSYGPTETTVVATVCDLSGQTFKQEIPIGQPISNIKTYILDPFLQPVPIGVPGELYIGGVGVARGYLHQPDLTAEKFIPNPFSNEANSLLYKTGDLVRYRNNANIEFLGRVDNQVKIRGFRIELGEIEAKLIQHSVVQDSVVIVREDNPGNKRLIAYIVPNTQNYELRNNSELISRLRQSLKGSLPEYMIPSTFVLLEKLPLTPNGKIDRRALPKPGLQEFENNFVAPRTDTEIVLAKLWCEVLGLEKLGVNNNFFEMGGNSLLTTQLIMKIRSYFQVNLPLRVLFESPTVNSLAINLEKYQPDISNELSSENIINWEQETILDPTIYPETPWKKTETEPNHILLTGATGFLGAFLLFELLQQTNANIYCLVRANNLEAGKKKLQNALESYLIWNASFSQRIIPVIGDLFQPLLGLNEQKFQELAHQIDVIYHNGAWVHHIYPYSVLKAANVIGTQEVLRLAGQAKTKTVHFISTASIFSPLKVSAVTVADEANTIDDYPVPSNGYVQTKWVCEKLIKTAQQRGLPISVYRIGRVSGHSQTGVFNVNDFVYKLLIGCVQLGSVPDRDIQEDIMPVDYVSQAIIHLSKQEEFLGKAFHLVNTQLLHTNTLLQVIQSFGYQIQQLSYEDWRLKLINIAGASSEHPLYPLVPFFSEDTSNKQAVKSGILKFDCQNAIAGLSNSQIICPDIDEKLLSTYISYLAKQGFLDKK